MADDKCVAVPLVEQLRSVPLNAKLLIDTPNALGCMDTRSIPVGRLCHEATKAIGAKVSDKVQMPEKARAGIEVLHRVVESLLTTSRYVDEEGEATMALADLSDCIADPPFKLAAGVRILPEPRVTRAADPSEPDTKVAQREGYDEGWNDCLKAVATSGVMVNAPTFSVAEVDEAAAHCGISDGHRDLLRHALRCLSCGYVGSVDPESPKCPNCD